MRKIPTVFRRDPDDMRHVLPEVTPGCEWVLAGEGVPTRKYDGTCCLLDPDGKWWARREVKAGKAVPPGFVAIETDETTGKTVGWEPIAQSAFARWHTDALRGQHDDGDAARVPGTYELVGPKVNGNPEREDEHALLAHAFAEEVYVGPWSAYSYDVLQEELLKLRDTFGAEGVVWHHPDGRMAKLKAKDFR